MTFTFENHVLHMAAILLDGFNNIFGLLWRYDSIKGALENLAGSSQYFSYCEE